MSIRWDLLTLSALTALLAVLVWWSQRPASEPAQQLLPSPPQINAIRYQIGSVALTFQREEPDHWVIVEPVQTHADTDAVSLLLLLPQQQSYRHYAEHEVMLSKLGLDPPVASLWLNQIEIRFGTREPLHDHRFVWVGGLIHLIDDRHVARLREGLPGFVDRALLPPDSELTALHLPSFRITQQEGRWRSTPIGEAAPSALSAERIVAEWERARAERVETSPPLPPRLHTAIEVHLRSKNDPLRFVIVADRPQLILRRFDLGLDYRLPRTSNIEQLGLSGSNPQSLFGSE